MSNQISFHSSTVRAYTEDDVDVIGFGDDDESPNNYIIISRYDEPDADDLPRDEMIGIQTSESNYEVSSAIANIELQRNHISILIKDENAGEVGAKQLTTDFNISDEEFTHLKKYIESLVLGSSIKFIENT